MGKFAERTKGWKVLALLGALCSSAACEVSSKADLLHDRLKDIIEAHGIEHDLEEVVINRALELQARDLPLSRQAADLKAFIGHIENAKIILQQAGASRANATTLEATADALLLGIPEEIVLSLVQHVPDKNISIVLDRISRLVLAGMSADDAAALTAIELKIPIQFR